MITIEQATCKEENCGTCNFNTANRYGGVGNKFNNNGYRRREHSYCKKNKGLDGLLTPNLVCGWWEPIKRSKIDSLKIVQEERILRYRKRHGLAGLLTLLGIILFHSFVSNINDLPTWATLGLVFPLSAYGMFAVSAWMGAFDTRYMNDDA